MYVISIKQNFHAFLANFQSLSVLLGPCSIYLCHMYLVQLIEHPILGIPNFMFIYFLSTYFFQIKVLN